MKRPTMLLEALLYQCSIDLGLSVERDVATLRHRLEHEGLSFLTITLPKLSDSLERGLESGFLTCCSNFRQHGSLPRFLGGFFRNVFDRSGELLPNPCVDSIAAIRQICRFFKKPKIGCTPARERDAIARFKAVEAELSVMTPQVLRKDILLDQIAGIIWSQVFPEPDPSDIVCRHGPGVTADRVSVNNRNRLLEWYSRWEFCFPIDLHAVPSYGCGVTEGDSGAADRFAGIRTVDIRDESPVRIVFVPKTMSGPRVIATEPHAMQYVQQGLLGYIVPRVEQHRLTRRSVRFTDQSVNQDLARAASMDKGLATLDLKDASDRVHFELVRRIFRSSGILDYLEAARSAHAVLPDGSNIVLNKFASMGSAICFPVEAMVFYTIIQCAMHHLDKKRPSSSSIEHYSRSIAVYGDDIIIPVRYTDIVVHYLESFALKVNVDKSFWNGSFRESCGGDYFQGQAVKPVYARQLPHDDARSWTPETVMAWVSTADQFYLAGQWHISQAIRDMVESVLRSPVPRCRSDGGGVFFRSLLFDTNLKYNRDLHGWKQRRVDYIPQKVKDLIDGDARACLNKWYAVRGRRFARDSLGSFNGYSAVRGRSDVYLYQEPLVNVDGVRPDAGGLLSLQAYERSEGGNPNDLSGLDDSDVCSHSDRFDRHAAPRRNALDVLSDTELDFVFSTKRGAFRQKRRWFSLPS